MKSQLLAKCLFLSSTILATDARALVRLASGTLASDEILSALLPHCADQAVLVGVSTAADSEFSNLDVGVRRHLPRVGESVESLLQLKPTTVIVASYSRPAFLAQLSKLDVRTMRLSSPTSFEAIERNIAALGELAACPQVAESLTKAFRETVRGDAKGMTTGAKILPYFDGGHTAGANTTVNSIIEAAGAKNLSVQAGLDQWGVLDPEALVALDPHYILTTSAEAAKSLSFKTGWKSLEAVKRERFLIVPSKWLSSASHHAANAVVKVREELARRRVHLEN